ncbi:MAG: hypothetical protein IJM81_08735 [Prevotella sp.]|nr:hypothetical protein [Prevotella sp.]
MKKSYFIPTVKVSIVNSESLLAGYSEDLGGNGQNDVEFGAKELFDDEDDAPKSVWDSEE